MDIPDSVHLPPILADETHDLTFLKSTRKQTSYIYLDKLRLNVAMTECLFHSDRVLNFDLWLDTVYAKRSLSQKGRLSGQLFVY